LTAYILSQKRTTQYPYNNVSYRRKCVTYEQYL